MAFPEATVEAEWAFSGGKCECKIVSHKHPGIRCKVPLTKSNRGRTGIGCWETHHEDENPDNNSILNCGIYCWPCHELTLK